ncbi:histone acetylation-related protein [Phaffia rhodozyma]|uniref:Inhibitor of growth protein 3 n=1 Tax=Phaffia rhodozyma TaxID=264483 RepID=A0A0F7SVD7_PHARH|nr:histone acetylation-related protein [Phaffia rhodozyma]
MAHSPISHDLITVANFADTLDALPLELTRGFSDLRELDAVLSSSLIHLTESIKALTSILLDPTATPAERLAILREVAVFAQRFKLGGEDKIRVVGGAKRPLNSIESTLLTARSAVQAEGTLFLPPTIPGKRTRATRGGANAHADPSGSVKSRQDDWDESLPAGTKSPAKTNGSTAGGRRKDKKKADPSRNGSPALSTLGSQIGTSGVSPRISHAEPTSRQPRGNRAESSQPKNAEIPNAVEHLNLVDSVTSLGDGYGAGIDNLDAGDVGKKARSRGGRGNGGSSGGAGAGAGQKNSRHSSPETSTANTSRALEDEDDNTNSNTGTAGGSKHRRNPAGVKKRNGSHKAKASSQPGGPDVDMATGGGAGGGSSDSDENGPTRTVSAVVGSGGGPFPSSRFIGHGAEAAAASAIAAGSSGAPGVGPAGGGSTNPTGASQETEGEGGEGGDKRNYCYCNDISYGEMIGCDDMDCEIEWFHLTCLNLDAPPAGTWHCPTCAKRRADAAAAKERQKQARGARGQARAAR